jgi:hypothetical protein
MRVDFYKKEVISMKYIDPDNLLQPKENDAQIVAMHRIVVMAAIVAILILIVATISFYFGMAVARAVGVAIIANLL